MRGPGRTHVLQLGELLKPTHRPLPHEVTVYVEEGAVLLPPLHVQHHPHLAPGEGGAGVLSAPALAQALEHLSGSSHLHLVCCSQSILCWHLKLVVMQLVQGVKIVASGSI